MGHEGFFTRCPVSVKVKHKKRTVEAIEALRINVEPLTIDFMPAIVREPQTSRLTEFALEKWLLDVQTTFRPTSSTSIPIGQTRHHRVV